MFNTLVDYLNANGLTATYITDETGETFGEMDINGVRYPVCLNLSANIPDSLCNSITINGICYRFDVYEY